MAEASFQVIEQFCAPKSGVAVFNEDGLVITDRFVGVFDGATDLRPCEEITPGAPTPGRLAMEALVAAIEQMDGDGCGDPEVLVGRLHRAVASLDDPPGEPVAVGAVFDSHAGHVVRVGTVAVGVDGQFSVPVKPVDVIAAAARAHNLRWHLMAGSSIESLQAADLGRHLVLPLLREQRRFRNDSTSPLGFGALDGTSTPDVLIDVLPVPAGSELVLASDGYIAPQGDLESTERVLAERNTDDPLQMDAPPGTKGVLPGNDSFDDRTYVRIRA